MIDTITIFLKEENFKITEYNSFNPSAKGIFEYPYYSLPRSYIDCYQNASAKDKEQGIYKPQLTLTKRVRKGGFSIGLKVQFSAPKLLYGNNFDELENKDLSLVIDKLFKTLKTMYVETTKEALLNSDLVAIHFGKNIILKDCTVSLINNTISKMDISKRLDSNQTDFRNEGHSIKYRTKTFELTFYDKIKDLKQSNISESRALEDNNYPQKDLFTNSEEKSLEVLRMELRLNDKRQIRKALQENGMNPKSIQLKHLFNKEVAKRILINNWDKYISPSLSIVLFAEQDGKTQIEKLKSKGFSTKKSLRIAMALKVIGEDGIRAYKGIDPTYHRIKKDLEFIDLSENFLYDKFKEVKSSIQSMETLKLDDYKERM